MTNHTFIGLLREWTGNYCVYQHRLGPPPNPIIYIGTCMLREVFQMPDANRNATWRNYTAQYPDTPGELIIIHTSPDKTECANMRYRLVNELQPYCNVNGRPTTSVIICDQTGQEFPTATAAANWVGSNPSNVGKHLDRLAGYKSVKGYTFTRIEK